VTKHLRQLIKRRKIYFVSQFQRLQSIVTFPHHFGPVVMQNIRTESTQWNEPTNLPGGWEAKGEQGRE
jgi:hypothetical protein